MRKKITAATPITTNGKLPAARVVAGTEDLQTSAGA